MTVVKLVRCWVRVRVRCLQLAAPESRVATADVLEAPQRGLVGGCIILGIACFSSMDITGINSLFFRDELVHRGASVTDDCLFRLYLFVCKTNALLTSHRHMLPSLWILRRRQCLFLQVQISKVTAEPPEPEVRLGPKDVYTLHTEVRKREGTSPCLADSLQPP